MNEVALILGWIVIVIAALFAAWEIGAFIGRLIIALIMTYQWKSEDEREEFHRGGGL